MDRVGGILISVVVLHLLTDTTALVTRSQWGSTSSRGGSYISGALGQVFIHHTATPACYSKSSCSSRVKSIQNHHVGTNGWADIGYSFLIGQDGRVYEGRGWHRSGAHTYKHNSDSYGIALIGNFVSATPNAASLDALTTFMDAASSSGDLTSDYKILGHKDVGSTSCPGTKLYDIIKKWSNYGEY